MMSSMVLDNKIPIIGYSEGSRYAYILSRKCKRKQGAQTMGQRESGRIPKPDRRADGGKGRNDEKVRKTNVLREREMLSKRQEWKPLNEHEQQSAWEQAQARQRVVLEGMQGVQEVQRELIQQMDNRGQRDLAQQMEQWMANRGRQ
jgi:hypothetical protein